MKAGTVKESLVEHQPQVNFTITYSGLISYCFSQGSNEKQELIKTEQVISEVLDQAKVEMYG